MIMDELKLCFFFVFVFFLFSFVLHYVVNGTLPRQCDSLSKGTPVVYRDLSILDSHINVSLNLRLFFFLFLIKEIIQNQL